MLNLKRGFVSDSLDPGGDVGVFGESSKLKRPREFRV